LTLWVTEAALAAWHAPATGKRGGQPVYSDVAIETGLALLGLDLPIPDHTTFSRRGGRLTVSPQRAERNEPLHLLVDSTGVKIYGEGEWLDQKHGAGLAGAGVSCISRSTPERRRSPRWS
jgi:Transposase DDE domain